MKAKLYAVLTGLSIAGTLWANKLHSQSAIEKLTGQVLRANQANNAVQGANNTVKSTKNTVQDVKNTVTGLFGKKKKAASSTDSSSAPKVAKVTVIAINNIDYATLKSFEDSLQTVKGVASTRKNFNSGTSTIEVGFAGEADELWDLIPARFQALFDLKALDERKITIELKKAQ